MNSTIQIDDILNFNPADLNVFNEKGSNQDPSIYKTNPKDAKSDDGVYRAKLRILLNPRSPKDSIVQQAFYWLNSMDGSRMVRSSLSIGDKSCPIFKAWKRQWFSGDDAKKAFAKEIFDKKESYWVIVQILEDINKPELVGQFRYMKLAKDIYEKLIAKMNPSAASGKVPYPVLDYTVGLALDLEVSPGPDDAANPERKQREISYSLSQFGEYAPIIKTDGTPLFSDEEIEIIDTYVQAVADSQYGKTAKKKQEGLATIEKVKPQMRPIAIKAVEYVKENAIDPSTGQLMDIVTACGYTPWDANTTDFVNKFIELVDNGINPGTMSYSQFEAAREIGYPVQPNPTATTQIINEPFGDALNVVSVEDEILPF